MARANRLLYNKRINVRILFLSLLFSGNIHSQVTYIDDIAPIIDKHCISCHADGQIGAMPLTNYKEVRSYANMIKYVTDVKLMPPFKANVNKVEYANQRILTDEEKSLINQWIQDGLHEGNGQRQYISKNLPTVKKYDASICMKESFEHYGIYYDQYQAFVIPTNFKEDKFISEVYFQPGNSKIVRSANISIANSGEGAEMDAWDPRYGYYTFGSLGFNPSQPNWYNWMPNSNLGDEPQKANLLIPKDSEMIMHLHYGPYGEIQSDSSCIHLNFADYQTTIKQNIPFIKSALLKDTFQILANQKKRVSTEFTIPIEVQLNAITPLAHLLCRSWEVLAILPNKEAIPLLSIDDWDFNWKEKYILKNKIVLPAGTRIYANAIYDNTIQNPFNPASPPHTMVQGRHMFDENFECSFEFIHEQNNLGYIKKPFSISEIGLNEISFHLYKSGTYRLIVHDLQTSEKMILTEKKYSKGNHMIRIENIAPNKGRYCISLESSSEVIDGWWFVIL